MDEHRYYAYRVDWSDEDQEYVGTCIEFPFLSYLSPRDGEAYRGIQQLVAGVVQDMIANGEPLPSIREPDKTPIPPDRATRPPKLS